jgi:hypothetical protein
MLPAPNSPLSRLAALALLLLVLAGLGLGAVAPLLRAYRVTLAALEEDLQSLKRYERVGRRGAALRRSIEALERDGAGAALWLPRGSDGAAVAALRNRLQRALNCTGARLIGLQPLPAEPVDGYRRVGLRLHFAADLDGLRRVLHALESGRPAAVLDNLSVRARPAAAAATPLDIQVDVLAFKPEAA